MSLRKKDSKHLTNESVTVVARGKNCTRDLPTPHQGEQQNIIWLRVDGSYMSDTDSGLNINNPVDFNYT